MDEERQHAVRRCEADAEDEEAEIKPHHREVPAERAVWEQGTNEDIRPLPSHGDGRQKPASPTDRGAGSLPPPGSILTSQCIGRVCQG